MSSPGRTSFQSVGMLNHVSSSSFGLPFILTDSVGHLSVSAHKTNMQHLLYTRRNLIKVIITYILPQLSILGYRGDFTMIVPSHFYKLRKITTWLLIRLLSTEVSNVNKEAVHPRATRITMACPFSSSCLCTWTGCLRASTSALENTNK